MRNGKRAFCDDCGPIVRKEEAWKYTQKGPGTRNYDPGYLMPLRRYNCLEYNTCLTRAALANGPMDCGDCDRYAADCIGYVPGFGGGVQVRPAANYKQNIRG